MLLYLHGFNSAPSSTKATQVAQYVATHHPQEPLAMPRLATAPSAVREQLLPLAQTALKAGEPLRLMGSSLGGYLASYLLETLVAETGQDQLKAVLINPAVRPYELLADYIGEQENPYTGERYRVEPEHMGQLQAMDTPVLLQPERYMVLLQTGDEVLDYRQAEAKYRLGQLRVERGGDHSFQGFEQRLPEAFAFLGLA
ncbi:YqiA/YcfP family alpha/beta fold hydrolase [Ferrimonas balearica]|uniref:YqiA/YcfP family alpha/beta fold hydrolase n=1 Tax=Ferrimonas balearica TaxID=44012 RepID=UPI001C99C2F1|nr:YqiA/YcfP family alpha/beta fold hydrolase [Ferrimonas balearica]MBY5923420.1 esterase YqiA [Ferrimonas balearica]MBY5995170.1 esterase YqiA [Ferrimonas balearica]